MAGERPLSLSLAYMRDHPAQAAQVLETVSPAEAAVVFSRIPARLGGRVLAGMLPYRAAACLDALDDARALELLAAAGTPPAVAILRHLSDARRDALIAGLPTAAAFASTLLLGYTDDTLGAWTDPDVIMLAADTRAAAALERVRQVDAHPWIFVVDSARRLLGAVTLRALLSAPEAATLSSLMQPLPHRLSANAPLAATPAHPGWESASMLPVVAPGDRLVGLMTRDALARALRTAAPTAAELSAETRLPTLLGRGYWHALSAALEACLLVLPAVPTLTGASRADPKRDGD